MTVPAVIYAAKSTADPRGSIATQLSDCRAAVEREGRRVVFEDKDEGKSAYKGNRGPGLAAAKRAAIAAAREGGEAELWVQHSDRLARGDGVTADHLAEVYFAMRREGVRLRSVQDDSNLEDVIRAVLIGERNTEDSRRKAAATRDGKRRAFDRGEHGGGPVQDGYGRVYEMDGARRVSRVVEDPTRAPVIRRLFDLADAGVADASIARRLNAEGHRTKQGRRWTRRRVQDTVTNPVYAGLVVWHRGQADEERRPGDHPALVDPEAFRRIQAFRAARDRAAGSDRTPGRPNSRHVLAGLAYCARCGEKMRPRVSTYRRKDGTNARSYVCQHYAEADGGCDQGVVDAEVVDAAFVRHLESFFVDFDGWLAAVAAERSADRASVEQSAAAERARLDAARRKEGLLADRYGDLLDAGDETEARACARALERCTEDAERSEHRLGELEAVLADLAADPAPVDAMLDFYNRLSEAVRGRLAREEVAEVNLGLREVLERVELDYVPLESGPVVQVLPVLKPEALALLGERQSAEATLLPVAENRPIVPPLHRVEAHPEQKGRTAHEPWHYGYTLNPRSAPRPASGDGTQQQSTIPAFVPDRFAPMLARAAQRWNVSAALLAAQLYAESNFNPFARSPANAQGIAQFMPATAEAMGLEDPFDPAQAIDAQAHLMRDLLRRFSSVPLALAAYNAGPARVAACMCVPPFPETRGYVARILGLLGGAGEPIPGAGLTVRLVR